MIRLRAGISYALSEATNEGHCGLPKDELMPLAAKRLEVPPDLIGTALTLELTEGTVVADTVGDKPCVFLAGLYRAERAIAERLVRFVNGRLPWPWIDPGKALPWVEQQVGLALAESQVEAIRLARVSKVLVMTGGPGVGKTTIIKAVLRILAAKGVRLLLCAPTGRAAKRMTEATGFEARTIHRLLEVNPKGGGFKRSDDNPLDCDLLAIDETSMVDVTLMQALMKAVPDDTALLIVSDIIQRLLAGLTLSRRVVRSARSRRKTDAHLLPVIKSDVGGTWLVGDTCLGFLLDVCGCPGRPGTLGLFVSGILRDGRASASREEHCRQDHCQFWMRHDCAGAGAVGQPLIV
jgi:hypothetical protein